MSRADPRRRTFSGGISLRSKCTCQEQTTTISTEKLLEADVSVGESAKRKNPDMYIEDSVELFTPERWCLVIFSSTVISGSSAYY